MLVYMSLMDSTDDRTKFERVYQSYKGLMFYTANRILNNPQDAEDAVHTAFVKIAENISKIQERKLLAAERPRRKLLLEKHAAHGTRQ